MSENELYFQALTAWGLDAQLNMIVEECSELIQAIQKFKRGQITNVTEELADVEIMCEQMRVIFSSYEIDQWKTKKLRRLENLLTHSRGVDEHNI